MSAPVREDSGMRCPVPTAAKSSECARSASKSQIATVTTLRLKDGRALCARRWPGSGDHTLVLLHGLLDSSEGWAALCERVDCTRIAFDLPGFGHSDPASPGSVAGYASDIAEGLAMLGAGRFTLVGHSLGGAVATELAELIPDKVAALVLLAPAGFGRINLAEAVSIPGARNLVEAALPFLLSSRLAVTVGYFTMVSNYRRPERELVDRLTSRGGSLVDGAREGTRAVVEAGRGDAFHRRRIRYRGPVSAIWGDRDRLVPPSHRHAVQAAFPRARIDLWRGMGHHALVERFDELIDVVREATAAGRRTTRRLHGLRQHELSEQVDDHGAAIGASPRRSRSRITSSSSPESARRARRTGPSTTCGASAGVGPTPAR
jgi:pimeloyl-ACP methyl ester carboxylesterase